MSLAGSKKGISLIPYLQDGRGFQLNLQNPPPDNAQLAGDCLSAPGADPVSRLLKAELLTGAGQGLEELLLLLSRDSYPSVDIDPAIVSNSLVDRIWRDSHEFFQSLPAFQQPLELFRPPDSPLEMPRFKSVFHCSRLKRYFHPPCPFCGRELELAEDDHLLDLHGLPPYSSSLERFLFCPRCIQGEAAVFYNIRTYRVTAQKVQVKNSEELVSSWGQLIEKAATGSNLPCIDCPESGRCFSQEKAVLQHVNILAFYPFYMFIFKAPGMQARYFLELASGRRDTDDYADPDRKFFFDPVDPRFFYEVLFLKLSFLCQVFRDIFSEPRIRILDASRLMDRLWVKMPPSSGLLPNMWSFVPIFAGLPEDIRETTRPRPLAGQVLLNFASLWFHVLCSNHTRNTLEVNRAINALVDMTEEGTGPSWSRAGDTVKDILCPGALFYESSGFRATADHLATWTEVMDFGAALIGEARKASVDLDINTLLRNAELLARTVKDSIFPQTGIPLGFHEQKPDNDSEIAMILDELLVKWKFDKRPQPAPEIQAKEWGKPQPAPTEKDFSTSPGTDISLEETLPLDTKGIVEDLPETVILGNRHGASGAISPGKKEPPPDKKDLSSTLELDQPRDDDDFLEETVILGPTDSTR